MASPLRVGLLGAGPWAKMATGPVLAAGPETIVTGVWSRTTAHAEELAAQLHTTSFATVDALLDTCDAVAIAVAPAAQPEFAVRAAQAGKALLLEKPLGADVTGAAAVVDAVHARGVGALVMLSNRFNPALDDFITAAELAEPLGGQGSFISGAFLDGPFAHGWRLERGAVLDVGPHLLDLLEAGLGEIVEVHAAGDRLGWVSLVCRHATGVTSTGALCCCAAGEGGTEVVVYGRRSNAHYDGARVDYEAWPARVRRDFAAVARGATHPASVDHALHLQRLIAGIESQLSG
jgi:predicted dehydrogenase